MARWEARPHTMLFQPYDLQKLNPGEHSAEIVLAWMGASNHLTSSYTQRFVDESLPKAFIALDNVKKPLIIIFTDYWKTTRKPVTSCPQLCMYKTHKTQRVFFWGHFGTWVSTKPAQTHSENWGPRHINAKYQRSNAQDMKSSADNN